MASEPRDAGSPAISVCIPVYQGGVYLERAIRSVLDQDVDGLELVVRDNGSTDGSAEVVRGFDDPRIRLERAETTVPLEENWARTVALATGEFVKIVCADDVLAPGTLRSQTEVLRADPTLALAAGRTDMIDAEDRVLFTGRHLPRPLLGTRSETEVCRAVVRHGGNPIGPPAAATFRRAHFEAIGGFRPELVFCMDLDLWVRLCAMGGLHGDPRTGASFRVHPGSASAATSREQFASQREFTRRLAARTDAGVRRRDRAAGVVGRYGAMARRHALFVYSTLRRARDGAADGPSEPRPASDRPRRAPRSR